MMVFPRLRLSAPVVEGRDVQRMQALLLVAGNPTKLDGRFGPETLIALNQFQRDNALQVDGVCGLKTWTKLLGG